MGHEYGGALWAMSMGVHYGPWVWGCIMGDEYGGVLWVMTNMQDRLSEMKTVLYAHILHIHNHAINNI